MHTAAMGRFLMSQNVVRIYIDLIGIVYKSSYQEEGFSCRRRKSENVQKRRKDKGHGKTSWSFYSATRNNSLAGKSKEVIE